MKTLGCRILGPGCRTDRHRVATPPAVPMSSPQTVRLLAGLDGHVSLAYEGTGTASARPWSRMPKALLGHRQPCVHQWHIARRCGALRVACACASPYLHVVPPSGTLATPSRDVAPMCPQVGDTTPWWVTFVEQRREELPAQEPPLRRLQDCVDAPCALRSYEQMHCGWREWADVFLREMKHHWMLHSQVLAAQQDVLEREWRLQQRLAHACDVEAEANKRMRDARDSETVVRLYSTMSTPPHLPSAHLADFDAGLIFTVDRGHVKPESDFDRAHLYASDIVHAALWRSPKKVTEDLRSHYTLHSSYYGEVQTLDADPIARLAAPDRQTLPDGVRVVVLNAPTTSHLPPTSGCDRATAEHQLLCSLALFYSKFFAGGYDALFPIVAAKRTVNIVALHVASRAIIGGISFSVARTVRDDPVLYVHYIACGDTCRRVHVQLGQEPVSHALFSMALSMLPASLVHVLTQSVGYKYSRSGGEILLQHDATAKPSSGRRFWNKLASRHVAARTVAPTKKGEDRRACARAGQSPGTLWDCRWPAPRR